jgi:hypothetical protein
LRDVAAAHTPDKEPKFQALARPILRRITHKDYSMKEYRIVPSNEPVTSIDVAGTPHHYFHSKKLGDCRAILIADDVNLTAAPKPRPTKPLSKGDKLDALMTCGERLRKRYRSLGDEHKALPESDRKGRKALFARMERVYQAMKRVSRKIGLLFSESS